MSGKTITVELTTPERSVFSRTADMVVLPAFKGEMGVLPGHAPFLVQLQAGEVRVTSGDTVDHFAVSGGFAEIKNNKVSLFAETAEMAGEIDSERARQALEKAKAEVVRPGIDPDVLMRAAASIARARLRLKISTGRRQGG